MLFNKRPSRAFLIEEKGSTTIEFVIWMPLMVGLLLLAFQASLLISAKGNYGRLAHEAARSVSRHAISAQEAEDWILDRWSGDRTPHATVDVEDGMVTVSIAHAASQIVTFNFLGLAEDFEIKARVVHAMEPLW